MSVRAEDLPPLSDAFDVHGVITSVTAESAGVLAAVRDFLEPFRSEASGHESMRPDISFDVRTSEMPVPVFGEAELLADFGYFRALASGTRRIAEADGLGWAEADVENASARIWLDGWGEDRAWGVTRLLFLPLWAQLLKMSGRYPIHAAGVTRNGRALLFPASSGSGKSVLTLNLARAGYALLGDDTQFVYSGEEGIRIGGFPERIALRPGAMQFFPDLADRTAASDGRVLVRPEELPGGVVSTYASPGLIAFPYLTGDPTSVTRPLGRGEALRRLTASTFFFADTSAVAGHMAAFSALVSGSTCVELGVGTDARRLVECLEGMEGQL